MSTEDLLKPRIKVIAPSPFVTDKVGDYLERRGVSEFGFGIKTKGKMAFYPKEAFKEWPHIFREMDWWEDRKLENLPEYIKSKRGNIVHKVTKWLNTGLCRVRDKPYSCFVELFIPATREEYEQYLKTKQK